MKLAILGTGFIVKDGALRALKEVPEIETVAIFALPRSKDKAEALAKQNSIPKVFTDYDELLADRPLRIHEAGIIGREECYRGKTVRLDRR